VLACDGVFDVMSRQEVIDFFANKLGYTTYGGPIGGVSTQQAADACDALIVECLAKHAYDNLSVVLIILGAPLRSATRSSPSSAASMGSGGLATNVSAMASSSAAMGASISSSAHGRPPPHAPSSAAGVSTPLRPNRHISETTPVSGDLHGTPVFQTLTRVFESNTIQDTEYDDEDLLSSPAARSTTVNPVRHLEFSDNEG
jgi:Protein phosphatase 2C